MSKPGILAELIQFPIRLREGIPDNFMRVPGLDRPSRSQDVFRIGRYLHAPPTRHNEIPGEFCFFQKADLLDDVEAMSSRLTAAGREMFVAGTSYRSGLLGFSPAWKGVGVWLRSRSRIAEWQTMQDC